MQSSVLKNLAPEVLKQRETAPHLKTSLLPTMTVELKDGSHKGAVVINRSDFNPTLHTEVEPKTAQEEKEEEMGTAKEGDAVAEYKIFKSFDYQDRFFEKNSTVKLRYSIARILSERFRCIWPVSQIAEVDEKPALRDQLLRGLGGEVEERDPANANTPGV